MTAFTTVVDALQCDLSCWITGVVD